MRRIVIVAEPHHFFDRSCLNPNALGNGLTHDICPWQSPHLCIGPFDFRDGFWGEVDSEEDNLRVDATVFGFGEEIGSYKCWVGGFISDNLDALVNGKDDCKSEATYQNFRRSGRHIDGNQSIRTVLHKHLCGGNPLVPRSEDPVYLGYAFRTVCQRCNGLSATGLEDHASPGEVSDVHRFGGRGCRLVLEVWRTRLHDIRRPAQGYQASKLARPWFLLGCTVTPWRSVERTANKPPPA